MPVRDSTVDVRSGLIIQSREAGKHVTRAKKSIRRGERIIEEYPTWFFHQGGASIEVYNKFLLLSADRQTSYLSFRYDEQCKKYYLDEFETGNLKDVQKRSKERKFKTKDPLSEAAQILAIFDCNKNPGGSHHPATDWLDFYVARIRHSCVPNVKVAWNTNLEAYTVHAIKAIAQGDELFYCFLKDPLEDFVNRKETLKGFGVDCNCRACNFTMLFPEGGSNARDIENARRDVSNLRVSVGPDSSATNLEAQYSRLINTLNQDSIVEMIEYKIEAYRGRAQEIAKARQPNGRLSRAQDAIEDLQYAVEWSIICFGPDSDAIKPLRFFYDQWRKDLPKESKKMPFRNLDLLSVQGSGIM